MEYTLSQICGFLGFVLGVLSTQTKTMPKTLLCQIFCNGLAMLSYVLLGSFSGFAIGAVGMTQSLIFFFLRKYDRKDPAWLYTLIVAAYIACSALAFRQLLDVVPLAAALFGAAALFQKKPFYYRLLLLFNGLVWVVYDVCVGAYTMLATHLFTIVSTLVGIFRLDIVKK